MAGKKGYKTVAKLLKDNGCELAEQVNGKAIWLTPSGAEVSLLLAMSDNTAKTLVKNLCTEHGWDDGRGKRKAQAVKERQAADRARFSAEAEASKREYLALVKRREWLAQGLSQREFAALTRQIEAAEREFNKWRRLMEAQPLPNTARHRA